MTHINIKSLSPEDVREIATHFDDHIRNGLSTDEQVAFLMTYSRDFENWQNHDPRYANPAVIVFQTSLLVHRLFLPENLMQLSDEVVVRLYRLANTAKLPDIKSFSMLCRIIIGTFSLKPAIRAIFAHFLMHPSDLCIVMPGGDPLFKTGTIAIEHEAQGSIKEPFMRSDIATLRNYHKPEWMNNVESISNGNTIAFRLGCSIAGKRITRNVALALLFASPKILSDLILEGNLAISSISLRDLALVSIYHSEPNDATLILSAIHRKKPQLLAALVDEFGNNLLWHRLYFDGRRWSRIDFNSPEEVKLQDFLSSVGVSPTRKNCYELSWRDVMDARELLKD